MRAMSPICKTAAARRTSSIRAGFGPESAALSERLVLLVAVEKGSVMLDEFHPLVGEWFRSTFGTTTEPQAQGWPAIRAGHDVLISAPTGSGKTLAAFTLALDELVRQASAGAIPDRTLTVYVSPLKALTNDVRENLEKPLAAIVTLANQSCDAARGDSHGGPDRRYHGGKAPANVANAAARAGHDAGVALHSADGRKVAPRFSPALPPLSSTRFTRSPATSVARILR